MKLTTLMVRHPWMRHTARLDTRLPTVLIGANDAGKSTHLDAIGLGLGEGSIEPGSEVQLIFEATDLDRWEVFRTRQEHGSQNQLMSAGDVNGVRKAKSAVEAQLGLAARFSGLAYLDATTDRRRATLHDLGVVRADLPTSRAVAILTEHGWDVGTILEQTSHLPQPATDWLTGFPDQEQVPHAVPWLGQLQQWLREQRNKTQGEIQRLRESLAQTRKERVEQPPLPAGNPAMWRGELETIEAELLKIATQRGAIEGARRARATLEQKGEAARAELDALPDDRALGKEQDEAAREVSDWADECARAARAVNVTSTAALASRGALRKLREHQQAVIQQQSEVAGQIVATNVVRGLLDAIMRLIASVEETAHEIADDPSYRDVVEAMQGLAPEDLTERAQKLVHDLDEANAAVARGVEDSQDAERALSEAKADVEKATAAAAAARVRLESAGRNTTRVMERRKKLTTEIDELQQALGELPEGHLAAGLDAGEQASLVRKAEIERALAALDDDAGEAAREEDRRAALSTAEQRRDAIGSLERIMREVHTQLQREAMEPLVEMTSRLCGEVLGRGFEVDEDLVPYLAEYQDPRDGEHRPRVPLGEASHSERTCGMLLFEASAVCRAKGWRRLIVDDLEHLERDRRWRLIGALAQLQAEGLIDNFLCAMVADGPPPSCDFPVHVVHLGNPEHTDADDPRTDESRPASTGTAARPAPTDEPARPAGGEREPDYSEPVSTSERAELERNGQLTLPGAASATARPHR